MISYTLLAGIPTNLGKSSESVQCAITGPCLHMRHRPAHCTDSEDLPKVVLQVQFGTNINWLAFEINRSKVKVMIRANMDINHVFKNVPFKRKHTGSLSQTI